MSIIEFDPDNLPEGEVFIDPQRLAGWLRAHFVRRPEEEQEAVVAETLAMTDAARQELVDQALVTSFLQVCSAPAVKPEFSILSRLTIDAIE